MDNYKNRAPGEARLRTSQQEGWDLNAIEPHLHFSKDCGAAQETACWAGTLLVASICRERGEYGREGMGWDRMGERKEGKEAGNEGRREGDEGGREGG